METKYDEEAYGSGERYRCDWIGDGESVDDLCTDEPAASYHVSFTHFEEVVEPWFAAVHVPLARVVEQACEIAFGGYVFVAWGEEGCWWWEGEE